MKEKIFLKAQIAMKKEICHACRKFKTARSLIQIVVYCVEFMIVY